MSTEVGQLAETAAAKYLERQGYQILDRNWRTKWCEIDIVAERDEEVHLVEVKYRGRSDFGGGFGAINHDKADRLRRAASAWSADHKYEGTCHIDVIAITGDPGSWQIELLEDALGF